MNNKKTHSGILSTFNPPDPPPPPDPNQPPAPPPAPPAGVSAGAAAPYVPPPAVDPLVARAQAAAAKAQADKEIAEAAAAQAKLVEEDDIRKKLNLLIKQNAELAENTRLANLEAYRANAVSNARANGIELLDALVQGRTNAEIDASVNIAIAEYQQEQARWAKKFNVDLSNPQTRTALPPAGTQQPPAGTQVPNGHVADAPPPGPPAEPPQQRTGLSVPSFMSPGDSRPGEGENVITDEFIKYATSPAGIADGTYMKYRGVLQAALRNASNGPNGEKWAFNPGYQLAPSMPQRFNEQQPQQRPQQPQQPTGGAATRGNAFAGVSQPNVHGVAQRGVPQANPFSPQPQFQNPGAHPMMNDQRGAPVPPGWTPQGPPTPESVDNGAPLDPGAAANAASQALAQMRARSGQPATGPLNAPRQTH